MVRLTDLWAASIRSISVFVRTPPMSKLFEQNPICWGLRGDPFLWEEMSSLLSNVPMPPTRLQVKEVLETTFLRLVGVPLDASASSVFVERYSRGGMSSGRVSLDFWRGQAVPLLLSRYAAMTSDFEKPGSGFLNE